MSMLKVLSKIWIILRVGNKLNVECVCPKVTQMITKLQPLIMSNSATQFVTETFANFLLENANNGNEILAVLDDIVEGADTVL